MVTSALLLMLASAADFRPAFALESVPRRARLVLDEGAPPPPPPPGIDEGQPPPAPPAAVLAPNYEGWSRSQLKAEYLRLEQARPSLGGPIGLMAGGGGAALVGAYIIEFALSVGTNSAAFFVVFGVLATVGVAMVAVGLVLLIRSLPARRELGTQMDDVQNRLDRIEQARTRPRYDDEVPPVPPPPAMPVPQVMLEGTPMTLARF